MVREDKQRGPVEDSRSETSGRTNSAKKVGWSQPQEACQHHHQKGFDLESTGVEKEGTTQESMAQRHRGKNAEKQSPLEGAGEDSPESGALADCCRWPTLLVGQKPKVAGGSVCSAGWYPSVRIKWQRLSCWTLPANISTPFFHAYHAYRHH